jgi:hypothetical protein
VQGKGSAPDELLFEDWPLLGAVTLWGLTVIILLYVV